MTNVVLTCDNTLCEKIITTFTPYKIENKAPGVRFSAKVDGCTITLYRSGKCLFQGANAEHYAKPYMTTPPSKPNTTLPTNFSSFSVLGSDETGTGDYFGPVTVAAVYVSKEQIPLLQTLGVKDSKLLKDDTMLALAPLIKAACPHKVLLLKNPKYNTLQAKGFSQGKMKGWMHNQALRLVIDQLDHYPQAILIDQFATKDVYFNYLKGRKDIVHERVYFATKAEQIHLSVAAASILARAAFVKEMETLSKTVGYPLPKGAGHKVDEVAARILRTRGEEFLQSITKWHFANTNKARKLC